MAKIIAFANQKGGVGKTTSCVNLAASLAATKRRILLVDMDPQGNATQGSGLAKEDIHHTVNEVLLGEAKATEACVSLSKAQFDLMPAHRDLTEAEIRLLALKNREERLKVALESMVNQYDYILIDCPPSLNMLTVNALVAATGVIIPMQCEYYALEGLSSLLKTIEGLKASCNPMLHIAGILRTMYDPRNRLTNEVSDELHGCFGDKVFRTVIPRNVRLAEAPSYGLPVLLYAKRSQGAEAYLALAGEMLRRESNLATKETTLTVDAVEC